MPRSLDRGGANLPGGDDDLDLCLARGDAACLNVVHLAQMVHLVIVVHLVKVIHLVKVVHLLKVVHLVRSTFLQVVHRVNARARWYCLKCREI